MAKISISEAARQVGLSRSALYRSYIKTGRLSVDRDSRGAPEIDTSEILRVFCDQFGATAKATEVHTDKIQLNTPFLQAEVARLQALVQVYEKQLDEAKLREEWLKAKVDALQPASLSGPGVRRPWWQFWG